MKFKCMTCKAILSIKWRYVKNTYKAAIKQDVFDCPNCGDPMIYKPNNK